MKTLHLRPLVAAAFAAALALPGAAQAATAQVIDLGGGPPTLQTVRYAAAAGETNSLKASYSAAMQLVTLVDTAGITPGPGCTRPSAADRTRVQCTVKLPDAPGITAELGDGNDKAVVTQLAAKLVGGDGRDVLRGGPGPNTLSGGNGSDKLIGGKLGDRITGGRGSDRISGRGGNDVIDALDALVDVVSCGGGRDRAMLDGFDQLSDLCEKRSRTFTPAATVVDASLKGSSALVEVGCPRDAPPRCKGRVSISRSGKRISTRKRFDLRHGKIKRLELKLARKVVKKIRNSDHYVVFATVRSHDRLGRIRTTSVRFDLAG